MSHDEIPVLTAIRQELVDGISRSTSARQRRSGHLLWVGPHGAMRIMVVLAVVALVAAVAAFLAPSDPGPAAFALARLPDGRVHVTVAPDFDQAERLQRALRDAGVKVKVITITSHPMFVGTIEFPSHQLDPRGVRRGKGEFWLDPARFRGTVEMLVYVAADPGEEWQQAPSVFHPAEPLGGLPCAVDGPIDPAILERQARSVGLRHLRWRVEASDPTAREVPSRNRRNGPPVTSSPPCACHPPCWR
jgi:hypothetical protein